MRLRIQVGASLLGGALLLSACGGGSTPETPSPVPTTGNPVIMAAGDISCDSATPNLPCKSRETSALILNERAQGRSVVVLALGDLQYQAGTLAEFNKNYNSTWGRFNDIVRPAPGNHEYETPGAAGYFDYFASKNVTVGARNQGWYSFNVGNWHFVSLNSNCGEIGGCGAGSAQYRFLQNDLLQSRQTCSVAYWHHTFLSSGRNGSAPEMLPMMRLLYENRVELALAGHDHSYERFNLMTPEQVPDTARGLRLFVVGTGGRDLYEFPRVLPNSAIRLNDSFGVLRIEMKEGSYDWAFVTIEGRVADSGSGACF